MTDFLRITSFGALYYATGDMAALYFEGLFPQGAKAGKLFNMAFPFETIYNVAERNALMALLKVKDTL